MTTIQAGLQASGRSIVINCVLALVKIVTGIIGDAYALVADGIESIADIFSSAIVWSGLRIATKPPDETHPYGHGKAESLAGIIVSLFLFCAAVLIAVQSVHEIQTPHGTPAWYTLLVLGLVIGVKEALFRANVRVGNALQSSALKGDAWHHRSDALTSLAAFVGISVAIIGGPGYENADDWAALLACVVIVYNAVDLLRTGVNEVMDASAPVALDREIRQIAGSVEGVLAVEKCRVRKSGLTLLMDIHLIVNGERTVRSGHDIAHAVKNRLLASTIPVTDIVVHIEPD